MMTGQLTLAVHILSVLAHREKEVVTSEELADGFGTNPVVIRRVLSSLKKANLVAGRRGIGGGSTLAKPASTITLLDAYIAINPDKIGVSIGSHSGRCAQEQPIAPIITKLLNNLCSDAEQQLQTSLKSVTISDFTQSIALEMFK